MKHCTHSLMALSLLVLLAGPISGQGIGIGSSSPEFQLHISDSVGAGGFTALIENRDSEGNGLRVKLGGLHPLWLTSDSAFAPAITVAPGTEELFDEVIVELRDYLISQDGISIGTGISDLLDSNSLFYQLQMNELLATGICAGEDYIGDLGNFILEQTGDMANSLITYLDTTSINDVFSLGEELVGLFQLPDLALESAPTTFNVLPANLPQFALSNLAYDPPNPSLYIPWPVDQTFTINIGPWVLPTANLNNSTQVLNFNSGLSNFNNLMANANSVFDNALSTAFNSLNTLDAAPMAFSGEPLNILLEWTLPLDSFQIPPFPEIPQFLPFCNDSMDLNSVYIDVTADISELLIELSGDNRITKENLFIEFVDVDNRRLGAITGQSLAEFTDDFLSPEVCLEIAGNIAGLASYDGNIIENAFHLGAKSFKYANDLNNLGVLYTSGHGDYAEWLEREDRSEEIGYGDIIAIKGGKISRDLSDAEQVMVVSKAPIVLGNIPPAAEEANGNNVAFIGQVPVKVIGPIETGDYIIGNPDTPGYGTAIKADQLSADKFKYVVGRSWEDNPLPGAKFVNAIVGMHNNAWVRPMSDLQARSNKLEIQVEANSSMIDELRSEMAILKSNK